MVPITRIFIAVVGAPNMPWRRSPTIQFITNVRIHICRVRLDRNLGRPLPAAIGTRFSPLDSDWQVPSHCEGAKTTRFAPGRRRRTRSTASSRTDPGATSNQRPSFDGPPPGNARRPDPQDALVAAHAWLRDL